jgi:hypothetical protein
MIASAMILLQPSPIAPDASFSDSEYTILANSIDEQITRALLSVERKCKTPQREPWSEQIPFVSIHVKYWRLKGAAIRNNYDVQETLDAILPLLPLTQPIINDGSGTDQQQLNTAYRHLTRTRKYVDILRKDFLQELRERIALRKTLKDLNLAASLNALINSYVKPSLFGASARFSVRLNMLL